MFGKVKRWLGIEGVKVTLELPAAVKASSEVVEGHLRFETMHNQVIEHIHVVLMEKYVRGRWKNKLADLYKLGEIELDDDIEVPADTPIIIDFKLPFTLSKSEMDEWADKNVVFRKLVNTAKVLKNVKSEFYVQAEVQVKGTALNPFDKQAIDIV
jgi:hypothetical protein